MGLGRFFVGVDVLDGSDGFGMVGWVLNYDCCCCCRCCYYHYHYYYYYYYQWSYKLAEQVYENAEEVYENTEQV